MKLYMKTQSGRYDAVIEYDISSKKTIVLAGSRVSPTVSTNFRSSNSILKKRALYVKDGIVTKDLEFKSPSIAASFVGGNSHNGYDDTRTLEGLTLRKYLETNNIPI